MSPVPCDQLTPDGMVVSDESESYNHINQILKILCEHIPPGNLRIETITGKKCIVYNQDGHDTVLLCAFITYSGTPHPLFEKRIQLKSWWKEFCIANKHLDVKFIGIYKYKELTMFVDFKSNYLDKKMHNSSAYVRTNDLYLALKGGEFERIDAKGNRMAILRSDRFNDYLWGKVDTKDPLIEVIKEINNEFPKNRFITAEEAIIDMLNSNDNNARQAEWPAFFTEHIYKDTIDEHDPPLLIEYTGSSHKGKDQLDLDLYFPGADFYGDLKTSVNDATEIIGNDVETVKRAIEQHGRFWLIIYYIEVEKDKDHHNEMAKRRMELLKIPCKDRPSYAEKMKHSVKYVRMEIAEINAFNLKDVTELFNQGHQPDGSPRKPKEKFIRKHLENCIIYEQEFQSDP